MADSEKNALSKPWWWIELVCGEIGLPYSKRSKVIIAAIFHLVLVVAIVSGGNQWGILSWVVLSFCLFWNVCLDGFNGSVFKAIREKIEQQESSANGFFQQHIRLMVPGVVTTLAIVVGVVLTFV